MSQFKIDTMLFNEFFSKDKGSKKFIDFLEFIREKYPDIIKKNGEIVTINAEIDIDFGIYNNGVIRYELTDILICDNIIFNNKVHFSCSNECVFNISFKNCIFYEKTDFSNIKFRKNIYFNNSIFHQYVDFHECEFDKSACFYGVIFKKVPNFYACYFSDKNLVNLVGLNIDALNFKEIEDYIIKNFQDKNFIKEKEHISHLYVNKYKIYFEKKQLEQKYQLKYAQNIKDSFRVIKDILITQNNTLEAQNWHKLELYAKEKEIENRIDIKSQNYTSFIDYILFKFYKNTSEHHTNLLKILNFTVGMIAIYFIILLCLIFLDTILVLLQLNKINILNYDFVFMQIIFLLCYLLCFIFFYFLFTCKYKFIVFFVNYASWTIFVAVIIFKPQLINPFVGIFSSDKLFENKLEQKLNNLNPGNIINIAKISQNDFNLQHIYNISFVELNIAKKIIVDNKNNLINLKDKDINKIKNFLGNTLYNEIIQIINRDKLLSDAIKSTSIFYNIILLLCVFSLQKTARKNSIVSN